VLRTASTECAVIVDVIEPRAMHAVRWRFEVQQFHGFPGVIGCGNGGRGDRRAPRHKAAIPQSARLGCYNELTALTASDHELQNPTH
jgi:hypothetical protein